MGNGLGNIDLDGLLMTENIVGGLNSSGKIMDKLSNLAEGAIPIIIFFSVGVILITRKTLLTQMFGMILICMGVVLGLMMFRSSRGF